MNFQSCFSQFSTITSADSLYMKQIAARRQIYKSYQLIRRWFTPITVVSFQIILILNIILVLIIDTLERNNQRILIMAKTQFAFLQHFKETFIPVIGTFDTFNLNTMNTKWSGIIQTFGKHRSQSDNSIVAAKKHPAICSTRNRHSVILTFHSLKDVEVYYLPLFHERQTFIRTDPQIAINTFYKSINSIRRQSVLISITLKLLCQEIIIIESSSIRSNPDMTGILKSHTVDKQINVFSGYCSG